MSWSISIIGKASLVSEKAKVDLDKITCQEPEETIKGLVGEIIDTALLSFPASYAVRITASGSQSPAYTAEYKPIPGKMTNSVKLEIEPIYGFVE